MTPDQYRTAIKALGLSQERAGQMLGIAPRTSQGYALGEYPVPEPVAKLLEAYERIQNLEAKLLYTDDRIAGLKAELEARRRMEGDARKYIKRLEADLWDCQEFLLPHRGMDPYSMFQWGPIDESGGPSPNYAARLYTAIEETLSESSSVYQSESYPRRRKAGDVP